MCHACIFSNNKKLEKEKKSSIVSSICLEYLAKKNLSSQPAYEFNSLNMS